MSAPNESGPLSGVRVLDLSIAAAGPYASAMLADQGADVIKVERPGIGDIGRWVGVQIDGISALYQICNRGKRCIAVNLDSDDGRDVVRRLAATSDVVMQNWRPGRRRQARHRLRRLRRDDLVYVSISGFGDVGPYAGKGAYDTVIQAYGGMGISQADPATGEPRFARQVAGRQGHRASPRRRRSPPRCSPASAGHGGQHVKLSMLDALVSFMWVDAAGNDVLLDGDGSQPGSFAAGARPFHFTDGWARRHADGQRRLLRHVPARSASTATTTRASRARHCASSNPSVSRALVERCHEAAATDDDGGGYGAHGGRAGALRRRPLAGRAGPRSPRAGRRPLRRRRAPRRRSDPSAPPPGDLHGTPATPGGPPRRSAPTPTPCSPISAWATASRSCAPPASSHVRLPRPERKSQWATG